MGLPNRPWASTRCLPIADRIQRSIFFYPNVYRNRFFLRIYLYQSKWKKKHNYFPRFRSVTTQSFSSFQFLLMQKSTFCSESMCIFSLQMWTSVRTTPTTALRHRCVTIPQALSSAHAMHFCLNGMEQTVLVSIDITCMYKKSS